MRLIDADALIKVLRIREDEWGTPDETWMPESDYGRVIKSMPTIDPVKHGKWEDKSVCDGDAIGEWQEAQCSVCGKYHTTPYMYYFDKFAYCPCCGARMDGDDNG